MSLNLDKTAWKRIALGDVASTSKEKCDPRDGTVERYVAGEHMDTDNLRIERWGEVGDGYLGPAFHRRFHPGQVLYGSRRTYLRKVAVAEFDGVCANTTFVIDANPAVLLPEFLPFVMSSEPFHAYAIGESKGSVNPYVNWSDIAQFQFDLPPLDEQQRIADLMWALEKHRNAVADLEHRLDVAAAAFLDEASEGGSETIRSIADVLIGFAFDSSGFTSEPAEGPRLLRGINIGVGATRWDEKDTVYWAGGATGRIDKFVLHEGDIVIPMDRPFTAAGDLRWAPISRHEEGGLLVQRVARLRPRLTDYLPVVRALVRSPRFQQSLNGALTGSFAPHLAHGDFDRFKFDPERGLAAAKKFLVMEHAERNTTELVTRVATLRSALLADVFGGAA